MFGLDVDDLPSSVLDCSAGAAAFVAELSDRGVRAVAADPAYALSPEDLRERVRADLGGCVDTMLKDEEHVTWSWYGSLEHREQLRHAAADRFPNDRATTPDRYRAASLPGLPFVDGESALAVCSHLLFTWAPELDRDWHRAALLELTRVATEVGVFPARAARERGAGGCPRAATSRSRRGRSGQPSGRGAVRVPARGARDAGAQSSGVSGRVDTTTVRARRSCGGRCGRMRRPMIMISGSR